MNEPKEEDIQKVAAWIDSEISHNEKRLESAENFGWADKAAVCRYALLRLKAIRHLIKKVFKWQERAGEMTSADHLREIDSIGQANEMYKFVQEIRDFGKEGK